MPRHGQLQVHLAWRRVGMATVAYLNASGTSIQSASIILPFSGGARIILGPHHTPGRMRGGIVRYAMKLRSFVSVRSWGAACKLLSSCQ